MGQPFHFAYFVDVDTCRPSRYSVSLTLAKRDRWIAWRLLTAATLWCHRTRRRLGAAPERSTWWVFSAAWAQELDAWLAAFRAGRHVFSPLCQYHYADEVIQVWSYLDRLIIHWLLTLLRPTFT